MKSPLESPALGASLSGLLAPCGGALRPAEPPPTDRVRIGVTLSGGGFRATFAGLGVVRYLADAGLLGDLRFVSSVSGGSVANGMIATRFPRLRDAWLHRRGVRRVGDRPARQAGELSIAEVEADPQHLADDRQTEPDGRSRLGVRRRGCSTTSSSSTWIQDVGGSSTPPTSRPGRGSGSNVMWSVTTSSASRRRRAPVCGLRRRSPRRQPYREHSRR